MEPFLIVKDEKIKINFKKNEIADNAIIMCKKIKVCVIWFFQILFYFGLK